MARIAAAAIVNAMCISVATSPAAASSRLVVVPRRMIGGGGVAGLDAAFASPPKERRAPSFRTRRRAASTTAGDPGDDGGANVDGTASEGGGGGGADTTTTTTTLGMERIYREWTVEDDRLLYDNRLLPPVRLASLLGRGMHGVEARLRKLSDVDSAAYSRLFAGAGGPDRRGSPPPDDDDYGGGGSGGGGGGGLTPAREVLRRIRWDGTLPSSSFSVLHYDRVRDGLVETPFDAPNDTVSGGETSFVFALPEHRIEGVKYLDRLVWDKSSRMDCVFGSMNGGGTTIDAVIENYDEWKREREVRIERDGRRQIEVLDELSIVLGEGRLGILKDMSSRLLRGEWDADGGGVRDYVKSVGGLYYEARRENSIAEDGDDDEGGGTNDGTTDIVDFMHLFSDLVALLSDESLREEILSEVESAVGRVRGGPVGGVSGAAPPPPELNEEDLEEKFVKGSGAGGQKVNKTSNRVILTHVPTGVRVECQDTRSLQQNRKIARKRLRFKVDAHLNGERSVVVQKAKVAVAKKAKNKERNKRRRQQKENEPDDE